MRRAIDAIWNHGDLDVADELFAPDYVNHDGLIADIVRGPEAIKISAALFHLAFPDLHVFVEELHTDNEMVVVHWTARTSPPEDPDRDFRSPVRQLLTGITRSRLAGGKIIESWTEWDRTRALRALDPAQIECQRARNPDQAGSRTTDKES